MGGNDILVWDAADTAINGGDGFDILRVDGNTNIDWSLITTTVTSIEIIDISGYDTANFGSVTVDFGDNSLTISACDILDLSDQTLLDVKALDLGFSVVDPALNGNDVFFVLNGSGTNGGGDGGDLLTLDDNTGWSLSGALNGDYNIFAHDTTSVVVFVESDIAVVDGDGTILFTPV